MQELRAQSSSAWAIIKAVDEATTAVCRVTVAPDELVSVSDEGDKKLMAVMFCILS